MSLPLDGFGLSGPELERGVATLGVLGGEGSLQRLAGDVGVSAERVVLAAWVVVLAAYSGKSALSVDVAVGGAVRRIDVDADWELSFGFLAGRLSRSLDGPGLPASVGSALFVLQPGGDGFDALVSGASVAVRVESGGGEDVLTASYDAARFERLTVVRMLGHVESVLSQALASGGAVRVGDVVVLPAAELSLLERWNATRVGWDEAATLVSLFGAVGGAGRGAAWSGDGGRGVCAVGS